MLFSAHWSCKGHNIALNMNSQLGWAACSLVCVCTLCHSVYKINRRYRLSSGSFAPLLRIRLFLRLLQGGLCSFVGRCRSFRPVILLQRITTSTVLRLIISTIYISIQFFSFRMVYFQERPSKNYPSGPFYWNHRSPSSWNDTQPLIKDAFENICIFTLLFCLVPFIIGELTHGGNK